MKGGVKDRVDVVDIGGEGTVLLTVEARADSKAARRGCTGTVANSVTIRPGPESQSSSQKLDTRAA